MISFYKDNSEAQVDGYANPANLLWLFGMWQTWQAVTRQEQAAWIMVYVSLRLFEGNVVTAEDYCPDWLQDLWKAALALTHEEVAASMLTAMSVSFQNVGSGQ